MSAEFLTAAASYFGMDPARLADKHMTTTADGLTVHFKVKLTADDYIGIADRMRALREPAPTDRHIPDEGEHRKLLAQQWDRMNGVQS